MSVYSATKPFSRQTRPSASRGVSSWGGVAGQCLGQRFAGHWFGAAAGGAEQGQIVGEAGQPPSLLALSSTESTSSALAVTPFGGPASFATRIP